MAGFGLHQALNMDRCLILHCRQSGPKILQPLAPQGSWQRGDRVGRPMSAIGTKRTSLFAPHMSAFGGKADMPFCTAHVCF